MSAYKHDACFLWASCTTRWLDGYWTTRGCHRRLCVLSFRSFGGICETASYPVRDLSSPRVGVSASCPVTDSIMMRWKLMHDCSCILSTSSSSWRHTTSQLSPPSVISPQSAGNRVVRISRCQSTAAAVLTSHMSRASRWNTAYLHTSLLFTC